MFDRLRQRSYDLEHLDKGDYTLEEYEGCLIELRRVNAWLGDTRALRQTLLAEIDQKKLETFSVLDVGAGSGELLRAAAIWTRSTNRRGMFVGVELNARSACAIAEESKDYPEISAIRGDGFNLPFADDAFDYAICSLTTHHFWDRAVITFLRELSRTARRSIFVIDLHRHPIAYYLYSTVGRLVLHNRLIREDGALSIRRSFKPDELIRLARLAGLEDIEVVRTFPYRLVLRARARQVDRPALASQRRQEPPAARARKVPAQ